MENIKILPMTLDDLEGIKTELEEKYDKFWTYGILKSEIANINSRYIVAKDKDGIIGFAGIRIILDEAHLMNIVVKKEKRGKKIGKLLLENLIKISKDVEVNMKNEVAINLYKKFEFNEVGIRKKYYNNVDDALIMTKAI